MKFYAETRVGKLLARSIQRIRSENEVIYENCFPETKRMKNYRKNPILGHGPPYHWWVSAWLASAAIRELSLQNPHPLANCGHGAAG